MNAVAIFGQFLFGLCCASLGIGCECTAHAMAHARNRLMIWADKCWDYAFKVGVWD